MDGVREHRRDVVGVMAVGEKIDDGAGRSGHG